MRGKEAKRASYSKHSPMTPEERQEWIEGIKRRLKIGEVYRIQGKWLRLVRKGEDYAVFVEKDRHSPFLTRSGCCVEVQTFWYRESAKTLDDSLFVNFLLEAALILAAIGFTMLAGTLICGAVLIFIGVIATIPAETAVHLISCAIVGAVIGCVLKRIS